MTLIRPRKVPGWQFFNNNVERSADVDLVPLEELDEDNREVAVLFSNALSGCTRVADLGCGGGFPAAYVAGHVDEVIGIDAAPEVAAAGIEQLGRAGITNASIMQGDATSTWFGNGEFDGAMLCGLLESMDWPDVDRVVSEASRLVNPGGRIAVLDQDWSAVMETMPTPNLIINEKGKLVIRTHERRQQPFSLTTTWYQVDPASAVGGRLMEMLGDKHRMSTTLGPDDVADDITDAWYEECAQFDAQTLSDTLKGAGFADVEVRRLPVWGGVLFAVACKSHGI